MTKSYLITLLCMVAGWAFSQQTITGVITDDTGLPLRIHSKHVFFCRKRIIMVH